MAGKTVMYASSAGSFVREANWFRFGHEFSFQRWEWNAETCTPHPNQTQQIGEYPDSRVWKTEFRDVIRRALAEGNVKWNLAKGYEESPIL